MQINLEKYHFVIFDKLGGRKLLSVDGCFQAILPEKDI